MSPEEIFDAYGLTCPPRVGTLRDPSRPTYGRSVARVMARLGMPPMPWQRYAVDVALEVADTGELAYRDITALVPRQSGKTTVILGVKVHRALAFTAEARRHAPYQRGRQRIIYAAQKRIDAEDKFINDHLPILLASPFRDRFRSKLSTGKEALLWDTGAYDGITSNTEDAAHGKTLDLAIEDEIFAAEDARLEAAFSPAMLTRWSPQHWRISTEGTEKSLYLAAKVEAGRAAVDAGVTAGLCYLEWSDLDGARDDPQAWLSCMPALCPTPAPCRCSPVWRHTVTIDTIRSELVKMQADPDNFDRAYLNRRKGSRAVPDPNVPTVAQWRALADPRAVPADPVAFAIEVTYDRSAAAIVAIGPHPDRADWLAVEVLEHRAGTEWIPARAAEMTERWKPVAWGLAIGGPAGSLVQPLADVGIVAPSGEPERGQLWIPTGPQLGAACGLLVDKVRQKTLWNRDDPRLNDALGCARTRPMVDSWMFARRGAGDISTLVATAVGVGAYEARKYLATVEALQPATAAVPLPSDRSLYRPTQRLTL